MISSEMAGPFYSPRGPLRSDRRDALVIGRVYVCWDGWWFRRLRWTARGWRQIRGWPAVPQRPMSWALAEMIE